MPEAKNNIFQLRVSKEEFFVLSKIDRVMQIDNHHKYYSILIKKHQNHLCFALLFLKDISSDRRYISTESLTILDLISVLADNFQIKLDQLKIKSAPNPTIDDQTDNQE